MWNLEYGRFGQKVKLGTRQDPGKPPKKRKSKRLRQKSSGKLPKKAKKAFKQRFDPYSVPQPKRLDYLFNSLRKGAWIAASLIKQRREAFEKRRHSLLSLKGALCYVCHEPTKATVRHHIIPICKGGSNRSYNLVPLCATCHGALHPWLTENPDTAAGILPAGADDSGSCNKPLQHVPTAEVIVGVPGPAQAGLSE